MKTQCLHCKAKFNAPEEYKGKKAKCPKCKEQFVVSPLIDVREETAQETRSDDSDFSARVLTAVISGAVCLVVGLAGGVFLTIPNRGKTKAKIAALENNLNEIQTVAQEEVQAAETEMARYRDELKRMSAEHERISTELEQAKKALQASSHKIEGSDTKANPMPVEKDRIVKLNYTVLSEDVHDVPIKTQVELNILVSGEISDNGLRNLLKKLYSSIKSRKGFKYHTSPTNIYIYAFTSKERYESGMGLWIAMLQESPGDVGPTISISQRQISQLGAKPEEKYGLSEEKRKIIWKEIILMQDKAMREAERRFPLDARLGPQKLREQVDNQLTLEQQLNEKYEKQLSKKYRLTEKQLKEIVIEGVNKAWPMPKLLP